MTILGLPLLGSLIGGLGGRYIGQKGSIIITIMNMLLTVFLSLFIFIENGFYGTATYIYIGKWINLDILTLNWALQYDSLTISMILVITIISSIVHIYSADYMKGDPHINRFMAYLSLFTFFMLILVTGDNIIQLFIGWEGVGLCSYLLINFWFTRIQANKSAMKAIMMNRIGDYGVSIGLFTIFYNFNTFNFDTIKAIIHLSYDNFIFDFHILSFIAFCLLIGTIGKSSQILLHTWLPDAMEGSPKVEYDPGFSPEVK